MEEKMYATKGNYAEEEKLDKEDIALLNKFIDLDNEKFRIEDKIASNENLKLATDETILKKHKELELTLLQLSMQIARKFDEKINRMYTYDEITEKMKGIELLIREREHKKDEIMKGISMN